jgi:hypothetical protein
MKQPHLKQTHDRAPPWTNAGGRWWRWASGRHGCRQMYGGSTVQRLGGQGEDETTVWPKRERRGEKWGGWPLSLDAGALKGSLSQAELLRGQMRRRQRAERTHRPKQRAWKCLVYPC